MKKILLLLFFAFWRFVAVSQFVMVGNGSWTTLTDSTYSATVEFQADLTGMGWLATQISDTFRIFTGTEQLYQITAVGTKSFSTAELTIKEMSGDWGAPIGQVYCYDPAGRVMIPQAPYGNSGATSQIQAAVDRYNARLADGGIDLSPYLTAVETRQEINDSLRWQKNGDDIYYNEGDVGIGDNTPSFPLDVENGQGQMAGYYVTKNQPGYEMGNEYKINKGFQPGGTGYLVIETDVRASGVINYLQVIMRGIRPHITTGIYNPGTWSLTLGVQTVAATIPSRLKAFGSGKFPVGNPEVWVGRDSVRDKVIFMLGSASTDWTNSGMFYIDRITTEDNYSIDIDSVRMLVTTDLSNYEFDAFSYNNRVWNPFRSGAVPFIVADNIGYKDLLQIHSTSGSSDALAGLSFAPNSSFSNIAETSTNYKVLMYAQREGISNYSDLIIEVPNISGVPFEAFRIAGNDGFIGIGGVTSPAYLVDMSGQNGGMQLTQDVSTSLPPIGSGGAMTYQTDGARGVYVSDGTSYRLLMWADDTQDSSLWKKLDSHIYYNQGNVGIGKSSGINYALDVDTGGRIDRTGGQDPYLLMSKSGVFVGSLRGFDEGIGFMTENNLETFVVEKTTGHIGINDLDPEFQLDVNGKSRFVDTLRLDERPEMEAEKLAGFDSSGNIVADTLPRLWHSFTEYTAADTLAVKHMEFINVNTTGGSYTITFDLANLPTGAEFKVVQNLGGNTITYATLGSEQFIYRDPSSKTVTTGSTTNTAEYKFYFDGTDLWFSTNAN